jgi:glycosyltransferase involved in cell wall biosynthesis
VPVPELLVSVVLPIYDGERYLAETIESVLGQTYSPVELIAVDDGSSDRSAEIAAGYPLKLIRQENHGVAGARNRGLAESAGELISFIDQDDLWRPEKLERQAARLRDEPEADLCVCEMQVFAEPGFDSARTQEPWRGGSRLATQLGLMLIRRELFERVGGFDPSYVTVNDAEWFLRANDLGASVTLLRESLQLYRMHGENTSAHAVGMRRETARALRASMARKRDAEAGGG